MDERDLEELRRRLAEFPVRRVRNIFLATMLLAVFAFGGLTTFYQVEAEEVGIVLRFGRFTGEPMPPGLHWKLPFFIDTVIPVPTSRRLSEEFGFRTLTPGVRSTRDRRSFHDESLMLTGDLNIAEVEWIVQYQIRNAEEFLYRVRNPADNLRDLAESAMRLVVGDYSITDVLTERRADIEQEVEENIQQALNLYSAGLEVTTVKLQNVNPPSDAQKTLDVKAAFDEVNEARLEKETTINDARKEYFKEIPEARGQARKMVAEAEGYRQKRINEAEGDVARFKAVLTKYQQYPEVTRTRLYLETLVEILPAVSQIYILDEAHGGPLQILDLKRAAGAVQRPESSTASRRSESGPRPERRGNRR